MDRVKTAIEAKDNMLEAARAMLAEKKSRLEGLRGQYEHAKVNASRAYVEFRFRRFRQLPSTEVTHQSATRKDQYDKAMAAAVQAFDAYSRAELEADDFDKFIADIESENP